MVKDIENTVWIGLEYFCSEGDALWSMPDEDIVRLAEEELIRMEILEPGSVLDGVRLRMKKAYPAYFDTYDRFPLVKEYLNTFENLFCIGRNGQHRYNNMDHSMLTAIEAVRALRGSVSRESVWEVNTEEEYHEVKRS